MNWGPPLPAIVDRGLCYTPWPVRESKIGTPPGYDARRRRPYPVLYLQQGADDRRTDWLDAAHARPVRGPADS